MWSVYTLNREQKLLKASDFENLDVNNDAEALTQTILLMREEQIETVMNRWDNVAGA